MVADLLMLTPFTIGAYVATICFGILLLWIIACRSPKEIGAYRVLLFVFVLFDTAYATCYVLLYPALGTMNGVFYFSSTTIVENPQYLFVFQTKNGVFGLTLGFLLEITVWSAIEYHFFRAFPDTTEAAIRPVTWKYPYLRADECIVADYWTAEGQLRWPQVLAMLFFSTSFSLEMSAVAYITFEIRKIFRINVISPKLLKIQKQLFYTLVLQFLIPLLIIYIPPNILMLLPLTRLHVDIDPFFFSYGISLFPLIDTLIILFGIRDYRVAFLKIIRLSSALSFYRPSSIAQSNSLTTQI